MSKVKIKIIFLGYIPHLIDIEKVKKWKSDLFEVIQPVNSVAIVGDSDGACWEFLDKNIEEQLPLRSEPDILLAVTNVPLQDNYYVRSFSDNRVCMTYNNMTEILKSENIPLENLLLLVLYLVALGYRHYGNKIPLMFELTQLGHDETRGCVFDMNGIKSDVIYSLNEPQLCHSCVERLTTKPKYKIEKDLIDKVQKELRKINKGQYYRISDFVKRRPILSILLSVLSAIIIGILASIIANIICGLLSTGHNIT